MSEQSFESGDDALSDDDPLLRAVARAPRAQEALETLLLPEPLRAGLGSRETTARGRLPEPGDVLDGRYRIDRRLGEGGMGVVFSATHLQTRKRVALKWMHAGSRLRSESQQLAARRRFEREARIAARVRHANVVDVYDASSDPERSYLVMEHLSGETLGARLRRGRLGWDEALALILPALRGVAALHAQGVIHRDLKPENIYLARAEDGLTVSKVLDFGVAALRAVEHEEQDETLTGAGTVLGTPGYMPLEQLRGERTLDVRTDVYALGVVLYEALSGTRPVRAGNAAEHAARLATEQPVALGSLVPELRGARSEAVMKALERQRELRYPSVDALSQALMRARPATRLRALALTLVGIFLGAALIAVGVSTLRSGMGAHKEMGAPGVLPNVGQRDPPQAQAREKPLDDATTSVAPSRLATPPKEADAPSLDRLPVTREADEQRSRAVAAPARAAQRGSSAPRAASKQVRAAKADAPAEQAPQAKPADRATSLSPEDF